MLCIQSFNQQADNRAAQAPRTETGVRRGGTATATDPIAAPDHTDCPAIRVPRGARRKPLVLRGRPPRRILAGRMPCDGHLQSRAFAWNVE